MSQTAGVAPWALLMQKKGLKPGITFTFCTMGKHSIPRARTCVYRDWLFNDISTGVLAFTTDKRMAKVEELALNDSNFEACFYFADTAHQFRLKGKCTSIGDGINQTKDVVPAFYNSFYESFHKPNSTGPEQWSHEFNRVWDLLSSGMQSSFKKPAPGSEMTPEKKKLGQDIRNQKDGIAVSEARSNFLVMLMFVTSVDMVDVTGAGYRVVYSLDKNNEWTAKEVCP